MSRKRTWSLVAVAAAGILGTGTVLGVSAANASPDHRSTTDQHAMVHRDADKAGTARAIVVTTNREKAFLATRKLQVIKAVLGKFPHARILRIIRHRDDVWVVSLQLRDHRVGFVTVDRHLRVSKFVPLTRRDADDRMKHPSSDIVMSNTPYSPGHSS